MQLTSGVYYIFKIVGIDDKGVDSDPQNYTVTFSDGKIKRTNPDGTIVRTYITTPKTKLYNNLC